MDKVSGEIPQNEQSLSNDGPIALHFFHPGIAKEINPEQPDITAAVILYNLSLWQRNKYRQTEIEGRRYSFRSLLQLHADHPYYE